MSKFVKTSLSILLATLMLVSCASSSSQKNHEITKQDIFINSEQEKKKGRVKYVSFGRRGYFHCDYFRNMLNVNRSCPSHQFS